MDNLLEPIIITLPPKRVSRRNYRHPARLYARAARRQDSELYFIDLVIKHAKDRIEAMGFPGELVNETMLRQIARMWK